MIFRIFIILTLCIVAPLPAGALEVSFKKDALVKGDTITLGEIATCNVEKEVCKALQSQIIGKSPAPGKQFSTTASQVYQILARKIVLPQNITWKGSQNITVKRKGQTVGPDMLLEAVDQFIMENTAKLPNADIQFAPRSMPLPFALPEGDLTLEIIPSSRSILESSRVSVIIRVDGKVEENLSILGKFVALAPVAVASTHLKRGELLTPANTRIEQRDIASVREPSLGTRQILGKRLKKTLRQGNIISLDDVEFPPLVRKGQLVKIIINSGNLFLTATGIAKSNGKLDQIIRVINTSSKKLVFCRVSAPGIVEVAI